MNKATTMSDVLERIQEIERMKPTISAGIDLTTLPRHVVDKLFLNLASRERWARLHPELVHELWALEREKLEHEKVLLTVGDERTLEKHLIREGAELLRRRAAKKGRKKP